MTLSACATLTDHFTGLASDAKAQEDAYRKAASAEIGRLEGLRVAAFRRARLIRLLEEAAGATDDDPLAAQRSRLCAELGWDRKNAAHAEILDRLDPVAAAVRGDAADAAAVEDRLGSFERWFEETRRRSFYSLFDEYVQETPVVDF